VTAKIKILVEPFSWEDYGPEEKGHDTAEAAGLADAQEEFGTTENVIVVDTLGWIWANTTGIEIERAAAL